MNENILISVVIPTYSRNESLKRAIDSVLGQTYENLEIIVVDDNPKDSEWRTRSMQIMNDYKDESRITYILNEHNMGGGLARNCGINCASGKYIAFLDDDDVYLPERIEKQLRVFENSSNPKLALVYCYAKFINQDGNSTYSDRRDFHGNCIYEAMEQNCIAATSQWMVKKNAFEEVGLFPDVPCKQDSQAILRLLKNGYEVEVLPEELSLYYGYNIGKRISGVGKRNIIGEELYRLECRKLYYLLDDWQILNIEYRFAEKMYHYFACNRDSKLAWHEWRIMKQLNPRAAYIYKIKRIWYKVKG